MASPKTQDHGTSAITRRAGIVVAGTLASRLLGAARDAVIAAFFAVAATDTFFVAWTIPNTLRSLLAEGAVSAAFVPTFVGEHERGGNGAAKRYYAHFAGTMLLVLCLVGGLGVLTAPYWAQAYGAGYRGDPARFEMLVSLTRLLFPYIIFAGLAALGMGALNALGHFAVPALAPALLNVCLIATPLLFLPVSRRLGIDDMHALGIAALTGGLLHVLVQLPSLRKIDMLPLPIPRLSDPAVRKSLALMVPLLLGTGINQVNVLLGRLFASFLAAGSQSYLYYGQRVVEIPQGMFAIAVASAALPSLAALHQRGDFDKARSTLAFSVRLILFVSIPAAVAIASLAEPIICVLFGRGEFGSGQVQLTAASLSIMALSVWAVASLHPLIRMFHAIGDTRTPVFCAGLNLATFATVSLLTMGSWGHVGIAVGLSSATCVQLTALTLLLQKRLQGMHLAEIAKSAARSLAAAGVMAAVVYDLARFGRWERGGNDPLNLGVLAGCTIAGIIIYLLTARLLGSPELAGMTNSLKRRLGQ